MSVKPSVLTYRWCFSVKLMVAVARASQIWACVHLPVWSEPVEHTEERGADILGSKVFVSKEESLDRWRRGGWAGLASVEGFGTHLKRRKSSFKYAAVVWVSSEGQLSRKCVCTFVYGTASVMFRWAGWSWRVSVQPPDSYSVPIQNDKKAECRY